MPAFRYFKSMMRVFLTILCLTTGPATADQTDPALDDLFATLGTSTPTQAQAIEGQIWWRWSQVPEGADQAAFDEAMRWIAQGFYPIAIEALSEVTEAYPTFAEAHNQLAIAYFASGKGALSQAAVERVVALEPRHFGAWAGLAQIRLQQGDARGAIDAAEIALRFNPHLDGLRQLISTAEAVIEGQSV